LVVVVPASTSAKVHKAAKQAAVPPGFVGMVVDGPLWPEASPGLDMAAQLDSMVSAGVQTLRMTFDWGSIQPYKNDAEVPPADKDEFTDVGGVPTKWTDLDQVVGLAAQRGLTILPLVLDAPQWDGIFDKRSVVERPKRIGPYANFVKALVQRYGPKGTFWSQNTGIRKQPIRMWQIWNEPNIRAFWSQQPGYATSYVALLKAAHTAIKSADPGAKIVLAGFPNFSWVALQRIYDVRGARSLFDVVAVHPYTKQPQGVITILTKVRQVMNAAGDKRKPMIADEISWPSSQGKTPHNNGFDFATTEAGQARNIATLLPLLGRDRRSLNLAAFYYYTWVGNERPNAQAFDYAGLLRYDSGNLTSKPALKAYTTGALALERCRQKAAVATRCAKPA
jgi:hypothetical protein